MSFDDLEYGSDMYTMGYEQALKDIEPKLIEIAQLKEILQDILQYADVAIDPTVEDSMTDAIAKRGEFIKAINRAKNKLNNKEE